MCNPMFPDPFINMTFINNHTIFVGFFHNFELIHHHFIYDLKLSNIVGKVAQY